jgi:hypothetical protein
MLKADETVFNGRFFSYLRTSIFDLQKKPRCRRAAAARVLRGKFFGEV